MKDPECVEFLQWALPRLHRRWEGFRKVRGQVCKRVQGRLAEQGLADLGAYRALLERTPDEWLMLDSFCPITISCFYRDKAVFDFLAGTLLPALARAAGARGASALRALSLGCASGEEPYTLALMWRLSVQPAFPGIALQVTATDVDDTVLARARAACYRASSLKRLPAAWRAQAFTPADTGYCLHAAYRAGVEFLRQDIRETLPAGTHELILCRNLVFTYFDEPFQRAILDRLIGHLAPGGALVIGRQERLPADGHGLASWPGAERLGIYRLAAEGAAR